ncbi:hypothetical protein [Methanolobus sp. WCC5]|uniref:hypothetical protein n=1 Tax=Methanolobus sp. WCC5 TaxID=3125785 RepID=UPI0032549490
MLIGNVSIPAVETFKVGEISRPIETIPGLGHRGYALAEFGAELPQAVLEGSLLQLYNTTRTIQQYKEDVEALANRGAVYNSVTNVKGRTGWISAISINVDDSPGVFWPFSLEGIWFDASQYSSELAADPVTMANSFGISGEYDLGTIEAATDVQCFDGSTEIFSPFHLFAGNCVIKNGLYQVTLAANTITISYWDTDQYVKIDDFTTGTFSRVTLEEINNDFVKCRTSNGITITVERGRAPYVSTPIPLSCSSLIPSDQTTSVDNYLTLGIGLYVASDIAMSIASNTISAGNRWIFHTESDVATVAAGCLVKSNLHRDIVRL